MEKYMTQITITEEKETELSSLLIWAAQAADYIVRVQDTGETITGDIVETCKRHRKAIKDMLMMLNDGSCTKYYIENPI